MSFSASVLVEKIFAASFIFRSKVFRLLLRLNVFYLPFLLPKFVFYFNSYPWPGFTWKRLYLGSNKCLSPTLFCIDFFFSLHLKSYSRVNSENYYNQFHSHKRTLTYLLNLVTKTDNETPNNTHSKNFATLLKRVSKI